ncbi:H-2 class II histocompatibility antigen, A-U alpha chain-like [Cheilinus undulatus]|uniref:H-2 class II histocompatibility antigen, A-U alpha chain-like n=1 Tax=Cheilinus undulatus TaxID=241271 RepID=UPI001BD51185|nr:H-2 class II histocompatibility antigen, A-U alpha chain-like [Cheilinus undulatus]
MAVKLFPLLLVICFAKCSQGKHLLRFLTFCTRNLKGDGQNDIEFDGDQLLHTDPFTDQIVPRLPEFKQQWLPDPGVSHDSYVSYGTCHYNIERVPGFYNYPPENIAIPTSQIYPRDEMEIGVPNTLICFINNFHPPMLDITWTRNGQPVDQADVSQTQYYSNKDFSFYMASYLDFTPQADDIYSCSVGHIGLAEPLTKFWEVKDIDHQLMETAVCVCGVILGLIGVVTGIWFIAKANKSCQA